MRIIKLFAFAVLTIFVANNARAANEINILVGDKKSAAYKYAKSKADDKTVFAERRLHKAFSRAYDLIKAKKKCPMPRVRGLAWPKCNLPASERYLIVNIKVAHGDYKGKGGRGNFALPETIAPDTTLRILGGYDDKFEKRAPFATPTTLFMGGTAFVFMGKKHMLKELYLSGFIIDIGGGNSYDGKTNSILKGTSAGVAHMTFGYLETEKLVIADNALYNSSHGAASPLIRARNDSAEVIIRNNFILNNIMAWKADSARNKIIPKQYTLVGNSFIMNWPYNPDPTTGNAGTLEMGNKYSAKKLVVSENLFAHNMGGAIQWTAKGEKAGVPTTIKNNLFFNNGGLFEESEAGAGAIVTKFGGFKNRDMPWNVIDIETVEDDYDWESEGNVALDPKVPITMIKPGFANSNSVSANNTVQNDVRGILGLNKKGGKVKIKNYAPRMGIDLKKMPFPTEPKAKKYGVSPSRVEQF